MTHAAVVMMLVTWAVIGTFTVRFFLMVLRTPLSEDDAGESEAPGSWESPGPK